MPGIGGRFGWNEPPPAAITITLASNTWPALVVTRNSGSPIFSTVSTISPRWKVAPERLDLLHQRVGEALAGNLRNARNVVDRLLGIELGALAADLVEDVDQVRLHVEQAELEHREQAHRARADDESVGLDHFGLGQHSENTLAIPLRNLVIVCMGDCLAGEMWRGKQKCTRTPPLMLHLV